MYKGKSIDKSSWDTNSDLDCQTQNFGPKKLDCHTQHLVTRLLTTPIHGISKKRWFFKCVPEGGEGRRER